MVIFLTFITYKYTLADCSILSLNEHRRSKAKHVSYTRRRDSEREVDSCCCELYIVSAVRGNVKECKKNLHFICMSNSWSRQVPRRFSWLSSYLPLHYNQRLSINKENTEVDWRILLKTTLYVYVGGYRQFIWHIIGISRGAVVYTVRNLLVP